MTRKTVAVSALVLGTLLLHTARVAAQLTPYDDFEGQRIAIRRWVGFSLLTTSLEVVRKLQGGRLALELTTYGGRDANEGSREEYNGLAVQQSAAVTQLGADVSIESYRLMTCGANPRLPVAWVDVGGNFFNDGSRPDPGDQTGDIRVRVALRAEDNSGTGTISAAIGRCDSVSCGIIQTLVDRPFDLPWRNGQPVTVLVTWRPERDDFVLRVTRGQQNEALVLNYNIFGFPDPEPRASNPVKFIRVRNRVPNCTNRQRWGAISATVDNVQTNDLTPPEAAE